MFGTRLFGPTLAITAFMCVIMGAIIGANAGFEASTLDEAQIDTSGVEHVEVSGDPSPRIQQAIAWFVNSVLDLTLAWANVVAVFVYKNQSWMDVTWTQRFIQAVHYGGLLSFLAYYGRHLWGFVGSVRAAK